jgi:hypothetical protein
VQWRARRLLTRGPGVAFCLPYRNRASGQNSLPVCVYDASAQLKAGQSEAQVILPDVGGGDALGSPSPHLPGNNQQGTEAGA